MAEKRKKPTADKAADAADLSVRLQAATGNIERVSADNIARRTEQKKNLKRSESDAKARAKGSEKQRREDEARRDEAAAKRLAELEYAEDYRKRLQRERRRALAEAKEAREAHEAQVRAERAQEIADILEQERREAKERSDRADALLGRLARIKAERSVDEEPTVKAEKADAAPEETAEITGPEVVAPVVEDMISDNTEYTEKAASTGSEEAAPPAADEYSQVSEASEDDRILIDIKDDRMLLNIGPDGSFYRIDETASEPSAEGNVGGFAEGNAQVEEEKIIGDYPDPGLSSNPIVAAIQTLGKSVYSTSTYRKYTDKSRAAIKELRRMITSAAENAALIGGEEGAAAAVIVQSIKAAGAIIEIRCDNLRLAVKFGQKSVESISEELRADIDRYNSGVAEFAAYTGEKLTRVSTSLPERIAAGTGLEVIPELTYSERYIEYNGEFAGERTKSYVITLSSGDEEPEVERERKKTAPGTYIVKPVVPAVSAMELLRGTYVYDENTYKSYLRVAKSAAKTIDKTIKRTSMGINLVEEENNKLTRKLDAQRKAIELAMAEMRVKIDDAKDVVFRKTLAILEGKKNKYEKNEKKLELNRAFMEDEGRFRSIRLNCFALRRERLILAFNTLSAAAATRNPKLITTAKNALLEEIIRYNCDAEECAALIGIPVTPVLASMADDILDGKICVDIPKIAVLKELVETVSDESRTVGKCETAAGYACCTFVIKSTNSSATANKTENKPRASGVIAGTSARPHSGLKTVNGHFFIGGTAHNGAGLADSLITGAMIAGPMMAANSGEGADPGVMAATALAMGTAVKASGMPGVADSAIDGTTVGETVTPETTDQGIAAAAAPAALAVAAAETAPEAPAFGEASPEANITPVADTAHSIEDVPAFDAVPASNVAPVIEDASAADTAPAFDEAPAFDTAPVSEAAPTVDVASVAESATEGTEFDFTPGVFGFDDEGNEADAGFEDNSQPMQTEDIPELSDSISDYDSGYSVEKTDESPFEIHNVEDDINTEAPAVDQDLPQVDISDAPEAPIEELSPRRLVKTVLDENGETVTYEEPYTEQLVDDGMGEEAVDTSGNSFAEEMYDGPMPVDVSDIENLPEDDNVLRLAPLPPPEDMEREELGEMGEGPLGGYGYPGNEIKHRDPAKYYDPDDISNLPPVVEIDDNADAIESDVLVKPTKRGLKKHLAYISKKIRKASHERSRLLRLKRSEKSVVPKVKHLISVLRVQKEIIDWYCNALSSAVEVGVKRRARSIASKLRAELKRYNRFVKEYERLTDDRLTRASLDIPAAILDGEDYQILPKVKMREFEAPENGVVYADGITEIADYEDDDFDDSAMTEKDLKARLQKDERELSKLRGDLNRKTKQKHNAWGVDRTILVAECFAIQKKIIDTLARDLHAACQVSAIKNIQSLKKELGYEIKQYNRLVSEYKASTGNILTPASESIPSDIISGKTYTPVARVGCVHGMDAELESEISAMSRNSYGVEDEDVGGAGRAAFRTQVNAQANKDLTLITRRADYQVSMLESERDIMDYRFGKEPAQVRREKRSITKRIEKIRSEHKSALRYENNDNRRYYAVVTSNPRTMTLRNRRADRTRVAALRSRIINLLNERDLINGKLMAVYGGEGELTLGSINQTWRRVKNNAAAKSKKKQKNLAKIVKSLPITVKDKERFYDLMNKKVDAESTLAFVKYRMKKEKLHKEDKECARRDIKELRNRIKRIERDIRDLMKTTKSRIAEVESGQMWMVAFLLVVVLVAVGVALYIHFFGNSFLSMFDVLSK